MPDDGRRVIFLGPSEEDDSTKGLSEAQTVLKGHKHWITSVALTPDGRTVAAGSQDKTIRVWEPARWDRVTGAGLLVLRDVDEINCRAFTPDGKTLATGDNDGAVRLWNPGTGQLQSTLPLHKTRVLALVFSHDGKTLVSGGVDQVIRFSDMAEGKEREGLRGQVGGCVNALAYSPNGTTLAIGAFTRDWPSEGGNQAERPGEVLLWDLRAGKELRRLRGHVGGVDALAFTPDGKTLATSGGFDKSVILWDAVEGTQRATLTGHAEPIRSLAMTTDGRILASGGWDGVIKLWDVASGKEQASFRGHAGWVTALAFTPDGNTLVSGSADRTLKLWDQKNLVGIPSDK